MSKECGEKDFKGYRHDAKQSMLRMIVVIDEFQVLFAEVNNEANEHLTGLLQALLKRGRSYGIHPIFPPKLCVVLPSLRP
ncbi:hypothetical protein [Helicobacter vulpis]|uniref:hypothetical protein n=1 Tax=Helicobacter vulpis TaxID=2316076 RepID=UPI001F3FB728|nr:hypothetical protein [Helicobacter vulpis]